MFRLFGSGAAALSVAERVALAVATVLIGSLLLAVSARVQVPLWPVPMTLQTLVVLVIGMTLGARFGAAVVAAYVLEGVLGLPVFAGTPERGVGLAYLAGPTGGYLIGFIVAAFVAGWMAEHGFAAGIARAIVAQAGGTAVILAFGAAWLAVLVGFDKAIAAGVVPFLVPSAVKIVLGGLLVGGIGSRFARTR